MKEELLTDTFIVSHKRQRYRTLLANGKRRARILKELDHLSDLDERFASAIASSTDVVSLLRDRGAPRLCHVISADTDLDGKEMPLEQAIRETELGLRGTLVGCLPGRLAYDYGEAGGQRMLLERGRSPRCAEDLLADRVPRERH